MMLFIDVTPTDYRQRAVPQTSIFINGNASHSYSHVMQNFTNTSATFNELIIWECCPRFSIFKIGGNLFISSASYPFVQIPVMSMSRQI